MCLDVKTNIIYFVEAEAIYQRKPDDTVSPVLTPEYFDRLVPTLDCCGLVLDGSNFIIADGSNHKVRKISLLTGSVQTLAEAPSGTVTDVCCDNVGNYYFCTTQREVKKIAPDGKVSLVADLGGDAVYPMAICWSCGFLYLLDSTKILKILPADGSRTQYADIGGYSICADHQGNLLVADHDRGKISLVTPEGPQLLYEHPNPAIMTIDNDGNAYFMGEGIFKITLSEGNVDILILFFCLIFLIFRSIPHCSKAV